MSGQFLNSYNQRVSTVPGGLSMVFVEIQGKLFSSGVLSLDACVDLCISHCRTETEAGLAQPDQRFRDWTSPLAEAYISSPSRYREQT